MKKIIIMVIALCLCLIGSAQKVDTLQVFKVGMGKALDQYIKACYNDSTEILARYWTNGKDTIATNAKDEPPKNRIFLYSKKKWVHNNADPQNFISWIYYEYKKPKK